MEANRRRTEQSRPVQMQTLLWITVENGEQLWRRKIASVPAGKRAAGVKTLWHEPPLLSEENTNGSG
jgi:hypothetical protein